MVAGEVKDDNFTFLCASQVPCVNGMKNGTVVNLDAITEAIVTVVEQMHQKSGARVDSSLVNISGLHVQGKITHSALTLPRRACEITPRHAADLMESCKIVSVPLDRHLLYFSPLEYVIDGQDGIKNPIGLCGSKLEAKVFIATAPFNQVQNICKAANAAGVGVEEVTLTSQANSYSVVRQEEKREGVLLVDFKRDLTEVAIFKDSALLFFKTIPRGQGYITDAIARRFNIPCELADDLKTRYGFLGDGPDVRNEETIPLEWMGRNQHIARGDLNRIIQEGLESIIGLSSKAIRDVENFNDIVKTGAVVTGGCTALEGFLDWAHTKAGFSLRQGQVIAGCQQACEDSYATSWGLVNGILEKAQKGSTKVNGSIFKKVFHKAGEVLGDYF